MNEDLTLVFKGSTYGEYEILREDFAKILRVLDLDVKEDVDIKRCEYGAKSDKFKAYCNRTKRIMVTLIVNDIPYYYGVKGNMAICKLKFLGGIKNE